MLTSCLDITLHGRHSSSYMDIRLSDSWKLWLWCESSSSSDFSCEQIDIMSSGLSSGLSSGFSSGLSSEARLKESLISLASLSSYIYCSWFASCIRIDPASSNSVIFFYYEWLSLVIRHLNVHRPRVHPRLWRTHVWYASAGWNTLDRTCIEWLLASSPSLCPFIKNCSYYGSCVARLAHWLKKFCYVLKLELTCPPHGAWWMTRLPYNYWVYCASNSWNLVD